MRFAKVTESPHPRGKNTTVIALFFAAILTIMAVGQLFSFEKFIPLIETYLLPGGYGTAVLVAGAIVVTEVFALPFLLRMKLSPLMRIMSMVSGWIAVSIWLKLAIWANVTTNDISNVGFLGTKVDLPIGWWAVFFAASLGVLAIWSAWGMWPFKKHH